MSTVLVSRHPPFQLVYQLCQVRDFLFGQRCNAKAALLAAGSIRVVHGFVTCAYRTSWARFIGNAGQTQEGSALMRWWAKQDLKSPSCTCIVYVSMTTRKKMLVWSRWCIAARAPLLHHANPWATLLFASTVTTDPRDSGRRILVLSCSDTLLLAMLRRQTPCQIASQHMKVPTMRMRGMLFKTPAKMMMVNVNAVDMHRLLKSSWAIMSWYG